MAARCLSASGDVETAETEEVALSETPPEKELGDSISPAALLDSLAALIKKHHETPITIEVWDGRTEEQLLREVRWGFPHPKTELSPQTDAERLPLRDIWETWYRERPAEQRLRVEREPIVRNLFLADGEAVAQDRLRFGALLLLEQDPTQVRRGPDRVRMLRAEPGLHPLQCFL